MISAIDSAFFAAYAQWIDVPKTVRTAKTPLDMIVADDPTSAGWVEWRLLQCDRERVARALDELERDSRIRYPPSFRRWYSTYYTLDMDVSVARLPDNPSNAPGQSLRRISSDSFGAAALGITSGQAPTRRSVRSCSPASTACSKPAWRTCVALPR